MSIIISDDELKSMGLSEKEFRLMIAIDFYKNKHFTSVQAAEFAQLDRISWQKELGKRKVAIYDLDEFKDDIE